MKNNKKESYFWTSYSDLMTSLFFIMLVLFVLIIVVLHNYHQKSTAELEKIKAELEQKNKEQQATIVQLNQVVQLGNQFKELGNSSALEYDEEKKMFYAKDFVGIEIFFSNSDIIKDSCLSTVDKVGTSLQSLIKTLYEKERQVQIAQTEQKKKHRRIESMKGYGCPVILDSASYGAW